MCAEYLFVICSPQEAEEEEEEAGVSRVLVTSRRSPHKVERVSGLVTLSHVDVPKVIKQDSFKKVITAQFGLKTAFKMYLK